MTSLCCHAPLRWICCSPNVQASQSGDDSASLRVLVSVVDEVRLPVLVVEPLEGGEPGDPLEVGTQLEELAVRGARGVRVLEGPEDRDRRRGQI